MQIGTPKLSCINCKEPTQIDIDIDIDIGTDIDVDIDTKMDVYIYIYTHICMYGTPTPFSPEKSTLYWGGAAHICKPPLHVSTSFLMFLGFR